MKKEFIEGRWYKLNDDHLGKFLLENKGYKYPECWPCKEYIDEIGEYYSYGTYFRKIPNIIEEVPISEIAHLLPKDHPDLQHIETIYELW